MVYEGSDLRLSRQYAWSYLENNVVQEMSVSYGSNGDVTYGKHEYRNGRFYAYWNYEKGTQIVTEWYEYVLDDKTETCIRHMANGQDYITAVIEYDENNNIVSRKNYSRDGSVLENYEERNYDLNGNCIKSTWYKGDGTEKNSYEYVYIQVERENSDVYVDYSNLLNY